jgi:S1-C subfamily serine protease
MIIALAALVLAPGAADAQQSGRVEIRRAPDGGTAEVIRVLTNRRVRLGVNVDLQHSASDTLGARIEGVTPGGPADKAGLRAGDVITRLDGEVLAAKTDGRTGLRSVPGMRLIELAARLAPDDTLSVEYVRDGRRRTTTLVTTDELEGVTFRSFPSVVQSLERMRELPRGEAPFTFWVYGSPLGDLELAPLNADLGQYFGTTEGVLVIDAPKEAGLNLRGGDIVLSVDGREPSSPQHLLRILRSYEPGEEFRMEIQRNRRRETVTARIQAPEQRTRSPRPDS